MLELKRMVARGMPAAKVVAENADLADGIERRVEQWRQLTAAEWGMNAEIYDLLQTPGITDVLINGTDLWIDKGCGLVPFEWKITSTEESRDLARQMAAAAGKRLDDAAPIVDAFLGDNIRLHAVLPPLAKPGPLISLRILRSVPYNLQDLTEAGTIVTPLPELMKHLVQKGITTLISGPTGSGKTTLLSTLLSIVPKQQRIVCVEEVAELKPDHPHVVHLQERQANVEGVGGIDLGELVRAALRMRPNWLVLGECRGAEIRDVLSALNTGHLGFTTIHANGVEDVPARLTALGSLAGLSEHAISAYSRAAIDCVLHMTRDTNGKRFLSEVGIMKQGKELQCTPALIRRGHKMERGPGFEDLCQRIKWQP